jgi:hypothetical protein
VNLAAFLQSLKVSDSLSGPVLNLAAGRSPGRQVAIPC